MTHPWGVGDEFSIATGLVVLAIGLAARKRNRTRERAALLLANGMAVGPLLLIMASPIPQILGWQVDLLDIAVNEGAHDDLLGRSLRDDPASARRIEMIT